MQHTRKRRRGSCQSKPNYDYYFYLFLPFINKTYINQAFSLFEKESRGRYLYFLCWFSLLLMLLKISFIDLSATKESFFYVIKLKFFMRLSYFSCDLASKDAANLFSFYFYRSPKFLFFYIFPRASSNLLTKLLPCIFFESQVSVIFLLSSFGRQFGSRKSLIDYFSFNDVSQ